MNLSGIHSLRESLAGLRAGLYARKSAYQGNKKSKGRSVKEQLDIARATSDDLGTQVVEEFIDDDRSASSYRTREREEFERMIEWIEAGKLDIVIAWASTRLQRDLAVYARLRDACIRNGVLWCYGGKVYDLSNKDDKFRTGLDALIGEREVDELRDNLMRTLRANAINGRPHAQAAYGYRRVYDERTGLYICTVKDEVEAPVVRQIVLGVGDGRESASIEREMNMGGVTPPTRYWTKGQVSRLAKWRPNLHENETIHPSWLARIGDAVDLRQEARDRLTAGEVPVEVARDFNERDEPLIMARWISPTITAYAIDVRYIGSRTRHGKVTSENAWPEIVSKAEHLQAVSMVKARKEKRAFNMRPGRAIHWLSGIMICDICEIDVNSDKQHGLPRYSCATPGPEGEKGYHASAQTSIVDPYVEDRLFAWLASPSFAVAYAKGDKELLRAVEEAKAEAKLLQTQLDDFYAEAGAGRLSARGLAAVEAEMLPKIEDAKKRAQSLAIPPAVKDLAGASVDEIRAAWKHLEFAQKRLIVEALVEVRLKPQGRERNKPVQTFVAVIPKVHLRATKAPGKAKLVKVA
ncbi:recombinase family protein [Streptomyces olivoreticuli]|uniref:recombinase family protein n=1 Tax=Streptomyces olivoreticuli TaxID=68246 RepID=UPI00265B3848|nr:recombinase family protein [Streptomyces olivoreticuli]WKK26542.1 recombinase family protein [Streptomyces olivoreticuli]